MTPNIIYRQKFGSHLYGTNTPNSDLDFKGVYIADIQDVIMNRVKDTIHHDTKSSGKESVKNSKDDTDFELIELRKFLKDALDGQTYALDMVFTPHEFVQIGSPAWDYIQLHKDKILSRQVAPFIGYCKSQAVKYGLKGTRLNEITKLSTFLQKFPRDMFIEQAMDGYVENEFVCKTTHRACYNKEWKEETWWSMLGKKHPMNARVGYVLDSLTGYMKHYGERAKEAQRNEGIDWKAISHAYRCMMQLEELADTGKITFPLPYKDYIKNIKSGKIPYSVIQDELPDLMTRVIKKVELTDKLSDQPDRKFWESFITISYVGQINLDHLRLTN